MPGEMLRQTDRKTALSVLLPPPFLIRPAKNPHTSSSALPSLTTYKTHSNLMATRIPPRMEKLPPITCHPAPIGPLGSTSSSGKRRQLGLRSRWIRSVPLPKIAASLQRSVAVDSSLSHPSGEEEEEGEEDEVGSKSAEEARHGVQRYLVAVEYDGSRFSGSQWQPSRRTVVGVLQDAFQNFIGQPVPVFCSSRTDAGVHALSNVCHADVERVSKRRPGEVLPPHDPGVVKKAVNHFLQVQKNEGDIRVIDVRSVPANFHARFNAQKRTYFYRLLSGPGALSLFESGRAWHVSDELDILSMQKACGILVGYHDFSSFRAARCQAKSPIKTLDGLHVSEVGSYFPLSTEREHGSFIKEQLIGDATVSGLPSDRSYGVHTEVGIYNNKDGQKFGLRKRHRCFIITATARSFLYHQVRMLVGVLKSVGTGDLSVNDVERILNARTVTTCPMAPACGLYLGHVKYDLP